MAVIYEELEGSPTVTMDWRGGSAQRVVLIDWNDIAAFFLELFPNPYNGWGSAAFPGYPWLVVDKAAVAPFDPSAPSGHGEDPNVFPGGARVTVDYLPYKQVLQNADKSGPGGDKGSSGGLNSADQAFVTHKVSVGGEFITWPAHNLQWQDAALTGVSDDYKPPKEFAVSGDVTASVVMPLIEHTISWAQVAWPPWTAIRQCLGKVNAYEFAGAPPGTLLFMGAEASRELTPTGIKAWHLDYKLSEKNYNVMNPAQPMGWNYFLRPDGQNAGTFQLLYRRPPIVDLQLGSAPGTKGTPRCILNGNMDTITGSMTASPEGFKQFPTVGQYRIIVDPGTASSEEMMVIAGAGTQNWTVLRGIAGGRVRPHQAGALVWQFPGRVYDIADLRYLFTLGMPIV